MKSLPVLATTLVILSPDMANACPFCDSETGREVRSAIVREDLGPNLLAILLPFAPVLGVAAAFHFGASPRNPRRETRVTS